MSALEDRIREIVREELAANGTTRKRYTVRDSASYLGVSESLVRKWVRLGTIQVERVGRSVVVPVEELQRILREGAT